MSKNVIIGIVSFASYIYPFSNIDSVGILSKIQNVWEYEYSYGGFAGTKKYPSDTYRLIVGPASSFKEYRNDTLITTDSFALQRNIQSGRTYYKIILTLKMLEGTVLGNEGYYINFPDDTTLVLDEGCCDRYAFYFTSIKSATNKDFRINKSSPNGLKQKRSVFNLSGKKIAGNEMNLPNGFYLENNRLRRVYYLK